ncbi:acyl-CoA dehydrogenase [Pseudonocardia xishanensis]|uniref:Acyl-CoA dehydrogenase family protein n=1 Tax=Pseudonocardia xishanensis TaxID=630995 RepID=A0ABP8S032_9PSEU
MDIDQLLSHPADQRYADVRNAVAWLTEKYDRDYIRKCTALEERPNELMAALAEGGLLGLGVAPEAGGQGGGLGEELTLVESLARAGVPAGTFLIGNFVRSLVLRYGSEEQVASFVPGSLDGTGIYSFAITEPDNGTNTFAMRTRADRADTGWMLNGEKCFISHIGSATHAMIVARSAPYDQAARSDGLSIFLTELPVAGLTATPMNIHQGGVDKQYIVRLEDVRLPATALVGEAGKGARYLFSALNPERLLVAAQAIGFATFLLAKATRYAGERAPFGRPIGEYQAVQHPLARAFIGLRAARSLMFEAADAIDAGAPAGVLSNSAKYLATEYACEALDAVTQVHGGYAFDEDYDIVTFHRQLRLWRIAPVNNDTLLNFVAEKALGLPTSR